MNFLDKLNHKLVLLIAIPLLVVLYFSVNQTFSALTLRGESDRLIELASLGRHVSSLVHELQKERGATAGFLGSKGKKFGPELARQRVETDAKATELQTFLTGFDAAAYNDKLQNGLGKALRQLGQLREKRGLVDQFQLPLKQALRYYTGMNGDFLGLVSEMSKISPDEKLSVMTAAYGDFLQSKERAGIERAVLANTFAKDRFGEGMFFKFLGLVTTQDTYSKAFLALANDDQIQFYKDTMKDEAVDETTRMRKVAMDKAASGGFGIDPVYWFKMQTRKINLLKRVEDRLAGDLVGKASTVAASATNRLILTLVISLLGIGVTVGLGWVVARNIFRQLGGEPAYIAEIADHIAHGDLDMPLQDNGGKRQGIYASIVSMRDKLRKQIEADRKAAREMQRIKTALDCVSTNVMVADDDYNIIYMNKSVQKMFHEAADDLRESIPGFNPNDLMGQNIDRFHRKPAHQRSMLAKLDGTSESQVTVGPRTFRIIANAVIDEQGSCLGTAVEWADLTEQLAMEAREQARQEEERKLAAENTRIRNALDNVSSSVMMADTDRRIIYMNKTAAELFREAEADIRQDLPNFSAEGLIGASIDDFHQNPSHQAGLLDNLNQTHDSEMVIGGHTMRIVANPVIDANGERLGTAVEWTDRTAEVAVEREIDGIVVAAGNGDLSRRISLDDKAGFFRQLSKGINALIGTVDTALNDIADTMKALSRGDLTQPIERDYQGTYGQVKQGINDTIARLEQIVGDLRDASGVISTASDEISAGNSNLSARTEQTPSSLEETAASMEELTSTVRNNADNARQANLLADNARQLAEKGGEVVGEAIQAMDEINSSSHRIAEIIGVIDEIAFQTNLLALNASVEAARAGEQGRGFAVVASEVRNLASRSARAAKEIKELIQDSGRKVEGGSELVSESGQTLGEIVEGVKKVADIIAEITAASAEQSAGIDQVNQAVTSMDEGTQQNAALAEETSAAAQSLNEKAREMDNMNSFFKLKNSPARNAPAAKPAASSTSAQPKPVAAAAPKPANRPAPAPAPTSKPVARSTQASKPAPVPQVSADDDDEWEEF